MFVTNFAGRLYIGFLLYMVAVAGLGFIISTTAQAAPRGTPTIVTNDVSSPVVVTGNISSASYKAIGLTQQLFIPYNAQSVSQYSTYHPYSIACSQEYQSSRICNTKDLSDNPNRIAIPASGAIVQPIYYITSSTNINYVDSYTGLYIGYTGNIADYKFILKSNNDFVSQQSAGVSYPVLCCAP